MDMGGPRKLMAWVAAIALVLTLSAAIPTIAQVPGASANAGTPEGPESSSISVHKFHDLDWDGIQDAGEPDVADWLMRLYRWDDTGLYVVAEGQTGADGIVTFTDLVPTRYRVWEETRECWALTTPLYAAYWDGGYYVIRDPTLGAAIRVEFGNVHDCTPSPGTITAHKFHDLDQDGIQDAGEPDIADWLMRLYQWDHTGELKVAEARTGDDGTVTFTDLVPTRYRVWEETQECWVPTAPASTYYWDRGYYVVQNLRAAEDAEIRFGNVYDCSIPPPSGGISVHKFHDLDRDGDQGADEPDVAGWLMRLYRWDDTGLYMVAEARTGADGTATFTGLVPTRYKVWEEARECWEPSTPPYMGYWDGGYFAIRDVYPDRVHKVKFGNTHLCEPEPSELMLDPDIVTNALPVDTSHEFLVTVLDQLSDPLPGVTVTFATNFGQFAGGGQFAQVTTDALGQAWVTVVSEMPGVARIRAWIDEDGDGRYDEGEVTDTPSVKIWEGEGPADVSVTKTAATTWDVAYDWTVAKTVDPDGLVLVQGSSGNVTYTISAVRAAITETYVVSGAIEVMNLGPNAAHVLYVEDATEYQDGGGGWTEMDRVTVAGESWIAVGDSGRWTYEMPLTPVVGAVAYRNVAYVRLANGRTGEETASQTVPFSLPLQPTSEQDACALVTDAQTIPGGFTAVDDYPVGGWRACGSTTFAVHKTVTNESAPVGSYTLDNVATVTEEDSGHTSQSQAMVTIAVPSGAGLLLDLQPKHAINLLPLDTTHVFTATVLNADGTPAASAWVLFVTNLGDFQESGTPSYGALTDASGRVSATIVHGGPGQATIQVWVDENYNGVPDPVEPRDSALKTWAYPAPTTLLLVPDVATDTLPVGVWRWHRFTATLLDQVGAPMEGISVSFATDFGQLAPPFTPTSIESDLLQGSGAAWPQADSDMYYEGRTGTAGQVSVDLGSDTPGTAHLRAWIDDGDDTFTPGEVPNDLSTMIWEGAAAVLLTLSPDRETVLSAHSVTYVARAQDAQGNVWDVTSDTEFSIDPGALGAWAGNVYTAQAVGTWTVTARYGTLEATATLQTTGYVFYFPIAQRNYTPPAPASTSLRSFTVRRGVWGRAR